MARGDMLTVFCYDVTNDARRNRIAAILQDVATRVQYCVFESRMSRKRADAIMKTIGDHLDKGDSLRVYAIGANGERRSHVLGDGVPLDNNAEYWLL